MIEKLLVLCIGIATICLASAFGLSGHWLFALIIALLGIFWWFGWYRKLLGVSWLYLVANSLFCVLGVWININPIWLVFGLLTSLSAWDLDRFDQRLKQIDRIALERVVIRKHLLRLGAVNVVGLVIGSAALLVRINLDLGWILILGLITVLGLSQIYNLFKQAISKH